MAPAVISGNWIAGELGGAWARGAVGDPPPAADSIYDLASLTKIISTSTLVAADWLGSGLDWDAYLAQPALAQLPELRGHWLERVTLGELWEHRAGLPAHKILFSPERRPPAPGDARARLWDQALESILRDAPVTPGETLYSDLGFLLLGLYLERLRGTALDAQWDSWKLQHGLGLEALSYGVAGDRLARCRATETRHPAGEVNDDKAASLGGVASHAGLFGSVTEVWTWLEALLEWQRQDPRLSAWWRPLGEARYSGGPQGRFHGGWDRPQDTPESQGGYPAPERTVGHLGYTGTALWWHPETRRAAVLLTNRVHPQHSAESQAAVKKLRQRFFSDFWQGTLKATWVPPQLNHQGNGFT